MALVVVVKLTFDNQRERERETSVLLWTGVDGRDIISTGCEDVAEVREENFAPETNVLHV